MPVVSSLDHLPTDGEFYSNNCVDGHCIGCGECCTDLLPTTRREIVRLRERQLEDSIKAGVHKAKVETKRKARVNALATNVLSDATRQQAALKVQQDFFGGGYR